MNILVLSDPKDPSIRNILELPEALAVGNAAQDFSPEVLARAEVLFVGQAATGVRATIESLWSQMPQLRWVHSQSAGVNHLLCPALKASSIPLTNARGVFSRSLAEYNLLAMLYFAKSVPRLRQQQKDRKWSPFVIEEIAVKTLGVVGYGDIGRAAARMAKNATGMRVVALRRRPEVPPADAVEDVVYGPDQLIDLVRESDYLLCAAPDTPLTRGMITREVIAAMKPSAVFINVGRGTVVDEKALCEALRTGKIRGAALDVVLEEPLHEDSELYSLENVLLSPHNADMTATFREDSAELFLKLWRDHVAGKPLYNLVDKEAGY
eukprot:CAMPEP_0198362034 /NCGR_PEP_ID=MMETSP1450-20131203/144479_1 /TAXON_ID=753684 ORGANISM="Madagascaria erythrocladiodes, Strain CCMP3234" /NCGR_SAMPLE_ID=MMETSP1450 /ASSEMBLY_ACC=CAM_ASM_001115 /LENGTH=322 /DNA_ID=CAMNT_0044069201 /DNA_START=153 /DNA_END=1121 /DNA_ORIENTATION=-